VNANETHFIDIRKVLNESKAGSAFQSKLKNEIKNNTKKFRDLEDEIRKEETDLISQKKIISSEDYDKKVKSLRKKVVKFQKDKQNSFNRIAKSRNDAKKILLDKMNPILKNYMQNNDIKIIVNKESIVLGDVNLEITASIIEILNKELSSIKLN
tara:strand:- start:1708 stop:2172 length:465 start_codon:yes stop_codon:yes gene_type:complete